jgi:hypothetical protein
VAERLYPERVVPILKGRSCGVEVEDTYIPIGTVVDLRQGGDNSFVLVVQVDSEIVDGVSYQLPQEEEQEYDLGDFLGTSHASGASADFVRYHFSRHSLVFNLGGGG